MKTKLIKYILVVLVLTGCNQNRISTSGNFSTYRKLDDSGTNILLVKGDDRRYTFNSSLRIDIETLEDLGEFLIDKNRVYRKYNISEETLILELEKVDRQTFQIIDNSIYAKDKLNVFDSRNGLIESADVKTFKVVQIDNMKRGKDKDNYYFWNEIITDTIGFKELINK